MRADFGQPPSTNVVVLNMATFRRPPARNNTLSWRACLGAWIGLSVASWAAVLTLANQLI